MSAPRLPDCFQKVPKKVTIVENGQILAVAVDCEGKVTQDTRVLSRISKLVLLIDTSAQSWCSF